uniref:26S proteasome non-ATPase regulatory subunit 1 homolog A n=1 Tax=Tanacetum cinerariifolium TaxID=118510 RepID=A0A6L2KW67_TANCI|nr:26S proteasome non-ATPase regulatory subunit 1 homolog A [Tanacetum cinerariifolium]
MHDTVIGKQTVRISWDGLSPVMDEAQTNVDVMTRHQDHILHYGGMYAFALAYAGTSNNKAICQLLHFDVSAVSDDVRKTAVLSLGFVWYSELE